jgi:hypothetical protein
MLQSEKEGSIMKRMVITLGSLMAMCMLCAVGTTMASAAGGPVWITKAGGELTATHSKGLKATSGVFVLKGTVLSVECKKIGTEKGKAEIIGGNPGTDKAQLKLSECAVVGKTVAECGATSLQPITGAVGEIVLAVKTVLAYPKGEKEGTLKSLDALFPEGDATNPDLLVEFELHGTNCGLLNDVKVPITATGTEVEVPIFKEKRKCAALSELGQVIIVFTTIASGEERKEVILNFPTTMIREAEMWEPTPVVFKAIKCELSGGGLLGAVNLVGELKIETEPIEEFGWKAL